ncbi:MAG: 50S ribosomal protein L23 [Firmicutes bacterium]|jgi:large subunit ribosomal protein L23|nr:50S ribosomal protein L23 [Bacillota bacterium]HOB22801.1 50S ribosomal protein L23 [Bacillota bacterium]HQD38924.1 50S ribosomal protein L23 [Bacillota bacterium]
MDVRDIIKRPLVTEKSTILQGEDKYTFAVDPRANKWQIKQAVEQIFGVKVIAVNTLRYKGKKRRMGRSEGYTPSWKKAVVTLAPGNKIEFFEGV